MAFSAINASAGFSDSLNPNASQWARRLGLLLSICIDGISSAWVTTIYIVATTSLVVQSINILFQCLIKDKAHIVTNFVVLSMSDCSHRDQSHAVTIRSRLLL